MLLWSDGFEGYGGVDNVAPSPTGIMADKYNAVNDESGFDLRTASGRTGGCLELGPSTDQSYFKTPDLTANTTLISGIAIWRYVMDVWQYYQEWPLLSFRDSSGNPCAELCVANDSFYVLDGNRNYIGGTRVSLERQVWHNVEMKVYSHTTAGTVEVRVNGCPVFTISSVNTTNSGAAVAVAVGGGGIDNKSVASTFLDDFYVCDGSGSDNNDFLGDITVRTLWPSGDNSVNFSATGNANYSTHYEQVNGLDSLPSSDWVMEDSTGNRDIYAMDDATDNFATIYGVIGWTYAKYVTTSETYKMVCDSNGTESASANITCAASSTYDKFVVEQDPDISGEWTNSTINGMLWGFEVQ